MQIIEIKFVNINMLTKTKYNYYLFVHKFSYLTIDFLPFYIRN